LKRLTSENKISQKQVIPDLLAIDKCIKNTTQKNKNSNQNRKRWCDPLSLNSVNMCAQGENSAYINQQDDADVNNIIMLINLKKISDNFEKLKVHYEKQEKIKVAEAEKKINEDTTITDKQKKIEAIEAAKKDQEKEKLDKIKNLESIKAAYDKIPNEGGIPKEINKLLNKKKLTHNDIDSFLKTWDLSNKLEYVLAILKDFKIIELDANKNKQKLIQEQIDNEQAVITKYLEYLKNTDVSKQPNELAGTHLLERAAKWVWSQFPKGKGGFLRNNKKSKKNKGGKKTKKHGKKTKKHGKTKGKRKNKKTRKLQKNKL